MGDKPSFANRGLTSRTHKELKKFNMNKRNNRGNEPSSQRKSYECSINTLKFVLHFLPTGKCKFKFLGDFISYQSEQLLSRRQVATRASETVESSCPFFPVGGNADCCVSAQLQKLKIELPYDPATPLLGTHPKDSCDRVWRISMLQLFCSQQQGHGSSLDVNQLVTRITKMWQIDTTEHCLSLNKGEIIESVRKFMELKNIILSKVTQAQKAKAIYSFSYVNTSFTFLNLYV